MITCKLNEALDVLSRRIYFTGSERKLIPENDGDPFRGEALDFAWDTVRDAEIAITVTLPERSFLDGVVIRTSQKTHLTS